MHIARIGIMGGSFNPVHLRHIQIAECALKEAKLSRVLFIPTGNPPHKHTELAPAEDRLEMTRLATEGRAAFAVSDVEIERSGVIYTVDTLKILKQRFPKADFFYIIGEDTLLDLPNWRNPDGVFSMCRFLVCRRSSMDASQHPICKELEERGARFQYLSLPPEDVSATAVREALARGEEPPALQPQVLEYIRLMGLYGTTPYLANGRAVYEKLRKDLNDRRLYHSLLVAYTARLLARKHGLDENAAAIAGLLHDCAKCMPLSEMQQIAKEHRLLLDKETLHNGSLLHGYVGATLAEVSYGVTDPNVLSAIACHTMGKVGMLPLDMVLFLADKIEPSRHSYPALETVRTLADTSLIAAMRCAMQNTLTYVLAQKTIPHPTTKRVADWLGHMESQENQRSEIHE